MSIVFCTYTHVDKDCSPTPFMTLSLQKGLLPSLGTVVSQVEAYYVNVRIILTKPLYTKFFMMKIAHAYYVSRSE